MKNAKYFAFLVLYSSYCVPLVVENETASLTQAKSFYSNYLMAEFLLMNNKTQEAFPVLDMLSKTLLSKNAQTFIDNVTVRALYKAERFSELCERPLKQGAGDENALLFAESYIKSGKEKEAYSLLSTLVKSNPFHDEAVYLFVLFLLQQKKNDEAFTVLNAFLNREHLQTRHAFFYFLKAKMFLEKNDFSNTHVALKKSLELNPLFDKAWLLESILYQQENNVDQAIYCLKKCIDVVEDNALLFKQYLGLLFKQERFQEAYEELKKKPEDTDEFFCDCALLEFKLEKFEEALKNCDKALKKNNRLSKAYLLKTEIFLKLKQPHDAFLCTTAWLMREKYNLVALTTLMALEKQGVPFSSIIVVLKNLQAEHPSRLYVASLADMYLGHQEYSQARECYERMVEKVHEPSLKSKLFYLIGYCWFKEKTFNRVEEPLKQALVTDNPFYPVYNLLAYYYATMGTNLPYALELIDAALKREENNSDFLDTKGYILVRIGRPTEAVSFFHKALLQKPDNKIILEHLSLVQ